MGLKMLKQLLLSILMLQIFNGVLSLRSCNDCQLLDKCTAAYYYAVHEQNDETMKLFENALCDSDGKKIFKVCCSDFPPVGVKKLENKNGVMNKEHLLPNKCGSISGERIIGGTQAKLYEFPWMALIAYRVRKRLQFQCGGTVINSKYILTAAHCVINKKIAVVRVGEYDISTITDCEYEIDKYICEDHLQDMNVEKTIPHENYQPFRNNDIALLRVAGEIFFDHPNVGPICLPLSSSLRNKVLDGEDGTVAGWGITETGSQSSVLLRVEVPIKTSAYCANLFDSHNKSDAIKTQFCAGQENKDSCGGDSGGPLMMKENYNSVNRYVQYGIVSYGPLQCGSNVPGVYTDIRKYVDWILNNIEK